jgi:hypothetical protein
MTALEIDSKLRQFGVVQSSKVVSTTALPFGGGGTAVTIAVVSFALTSFSRAVIGKAADLTWEVITKFFRSQRKIPGHVRLVFSTHVRRTAIELVAEYETWKMANSDAKNYRYYLALATGFTKARIPPSEIPVDLLDLLPDDFTTRPRGLKLSRRLD